MTDIIQIEILNKSGHDDLKFCISDLTADLTFDTYYFGLVTKPYENFHDLRECIAHFLKIWVTQLGQMKNGQTKYFLRKI